jgi:hypothetical protein
MAKIREKTDEIIDSAAEMAQIRGKTDQLSCCRSFFQMVDMGRANRASPVKIRCAGGANQPVALTPIITADNVPTAYGMNRGGSMG